MTKNSKNATARCIYKPDSQSTEEYIAIIQDAEALKKWRDGDKTIPLVEILDGFEVFTTGQGKQGVLERPSKQILETVFDTTNMDDILEKVLTVGRIQAADNVDKDKYHSRRDEGGMSRGSVSGGR